MQTHRGATPTKVDAVPRGSRSGELRRQVAIALGRQFNCRPNIGGLLPLALYFSS